MQNDFFSHLTSKAMRPASTPSEGSVLRPRLAGLFDPLAPSLPMTLDTRHTDLDTADDERLISAQPKVGPTIHQQEKMATVHSPDHPRQKGSLSLEMPVSTREQLDADPSQSDQLPEGQAIAKPVGPPQISKPEPLLAEELPKLDAPLTKSMPRVSSEISLSGSFSPLQSQNVMPFSVQAPLPEIPKMLPDPQPSRRRKTAQESNAPQKLSSEMVTNNNRSTEDDTSTSRVLGPSQMDARSRLVPVRTATERLGRANTRQDESPPPVIHVTIGRIEIKASAQTESPKRSSTPKPPIMSLDEYLHQRREGKA